MRGLLLFFRKKNEEESSFLKRSSLQSSRFCPERKRRREGFFLSLCGVFRVLQSGEGLLFGFEKFLGFHFIGFFLMDKKKEIFTVGGYIHTLLT